MEAVHTHSYTIRSSLCVLLLASPDLPEVELEFLALKNVSVSAARLTWSAADSSIQATSSELTLKKGINLCILLPLIQAALRMVGELFLLSSFSRYIFLSTSFCHGLRIVSLIPLTERGSIDLDDSILDKGVCSDELIVRGIVNHADDPRLLCYALTSPRKVASIETKGTELEVPSTDTDSMDTLGSKLGISGLTTELEFSLFAVVGALGSCMRTFVSGRTGDTHGVES